MLSKKDTDNTKKELMFDYSEEQVDKMFSYLDMVLERNEHINLTAVRDRDEAVQKHLVDSLSICNLPEYISAGSVIDIGTGAGFPGAFLAIASPDKDFTLLDSTLKRLKIIDEFADKLDISNAHTLHARAEEIYKKEEYAEKYDLCVSRAVANLSTLTSWSLPFVKKGGCFIAYKGSNYQEEINEASKNLKKYGGVLERIIETENKTSEISGHVLLVIKKI